MCEIIGVTELRRRFRAIFDRVVRQHVRYDLTRGSRPQAGLIPYDDFQRFQEMEARMVLERFDLLLQRLAAQSEAYSEAGVAADVAAACTVARWSGNAELERLVTTHEDREKGKRLWQEGRQLYEQPGMRSMVDRMHGEQD